MGMLKTKKKIAQDKAFAEAIGKKLKIERVKKRMHQAEIAVELGLTLPAVSKIEAGGCNLLLPHFYRYCFIVGASPSILLKETSHLLRDE